MLRAILEVPMTRFIFGVRRLRWRSACVVRLATPAVEAQGAAPPPESDAGRGRADDEGHLELGALGRHRRDRHLQPDHAGQADVRPRRWCSEGAVGVDGAHPRQGGAGRQPDAVQDRVPDGPRRQDAIGGGDGRDRVDLSRHDDHPHGLALPLHLRGQDLQRLGDREVPPGDADPRGLRRGPGVHEEQHPRLQGRADHPRRAGRHPADARA